MISDMAEKRIDGVVRVIASMSLGFLAFIRDKGVEREFTRPEEQDEEVDDQVEEGQFLYAERIACVYYRDDHQHIENERKGGQPREGSHDQQDRAENFRHDAEQQRECGRQSQRIGERSRERAERKQFRNAVRQHDDTDKEPKEQDTCRIEVFGEYAVGEEEFFHNKLIFRFLFRKKILIRFWFL